MGNRTLESLLNTDKTLNKRRSSLRSQINTVFDESVSSIPGRIILTLDYVENSYEERLGWSDRPMELVLERSDEDGPMNVYRLDR